LFAGGAALRISGRTLSARTDTRRAPGPTNLGRSTGTVPRRRTGQSDGTPPARVKLDQRIALRGLLPDRLGSRALCALPANSLSGTWVGGEFSRLLLPGRYLRGSRPL